MFHFDIGIAASAFALICTWFSHRSQPPEAVHVRL